jgi:spermidine synthase
MRNLAGAFGETSCYLAPIPSLLGGPLAFGWGSNALPATPIRLDVLRARFESQRIATRYYTPEVHAAAFALPRYLQETLFEALRAEYVPRDPHPTGARPW